MTCYLLCLCGTPPGCSTLQPFLSLVQTVRAASVRVHVIRTRSHKPGGVHLLRKGLGWEGSTDGSRSRCRTWILRVGLSHDAWHIPDAQQTFV